MCLRFPDVSQEGCSVNNKFAYRQGRRNVTPSSNEDYLYSADILNFLLLGHIHLRSGSSLLVFFLLDAPLPPSLFRNGLGEKLTQIQCTPSLLSHESGCM